MCFPEISQRNHVYGGYDSNRRLEKHLVVKSCHMGAKQKKQFIVEGKTFGFLPLPSLERPPFLGKETLHAGLQGSGFSKLVYYYHPFPPNDREPKFTQSEKKN